METPLVYVVTATFPDPSLIDDYITWLTSGHLQDVVILGKALSAVITRCDPDPMPPGSPPKPAHRVETRYVFPSRAFFTAYETGVAPRLRVAGAKIWGERGVQFQRWSGTLAGEFTAPAHHG
ncbi:hypothetical protein BH11PLA1_BH11PLA1_14610 [soil metagenome]